MAVIISIILVAILALSTVFAIMNINNDKIISGVKIKGIDVSGLTEDEAKSKIELIYQEKNSRDIELKYEDYEASINSELLEINYEIENAVKEAISVGKSNNIFVNNYNILFALIGKKDINVNMSINEENAKQKIEDIGTNLPGALEEPDYYIEGSNLIITKGKEGIKIDTENLLQKIKDKLGNINETNDIIEIPVINEKPQDIDIQKIHDEIYKEPVDAYITQNPTTVHPNVNGVNFAISVEEATKLLEEDKEEYRVPLKITVANKTIRDLGEEAFPDVLGTFTTRYDATNKNRSNNISLAAQKINGTVILPGETFSYNKTVGKRTKAAGFKEAGAYAGGKVIQEVGGGICQVSSTLYNAVVYANLEITERSNHCFESSYVAAGRDATVSWGTLDFKFKNNRQYPVKIEASANSGVNKITIKGIKEEKEYEVVIQSKVTSIIQMPVQYQENSDMNEGEERIIQYGHNGCTSVTYKILKLNGATISTELMSTDYYKPLERIIEKGTKKVLPQEPEEKPSQPEQPTPSPSENTEKPTSGEEGGE